MVNEKENIDPAGPDEAKELITLKGIWKIFDGVAVLRGVNLNLKAGEIHALLGGNGSGKSTLMKILSGVYTLDAGSIELDGVPVTMKGPAHAHEMGVYMVPQEPQVFPHLSVEENLCMGITLKRAEARERILELSRELGFSPIWPPRPVRFRSPTSSCSRLCAVYCTMPAYWFLMSRLHR